jgi:hypothetical protein
VSEKRLVPTFRVYLETRFGQAETVYHGPVVSPDRLEVATNLTEVHSICSRFHACLIYDRKWHLINWAHIVEITKGSRRFPIPWPLRNEPDEDQEEDSSETLS